MEQKSALAPQADAGHFISSLQLFNVIRQPLMMLPIALTVSSDAYVALKRVARALLAEELEDEMQIDLNASDAICARYFFLLVEPERANADSTGRRGNFAWETAAPQESMMAAGKDEPNSKKEKAAEKKAAKGASKRRKKGEPEPTVPTIEETSNDKAPFELSGIDILVPRGALVCIVGSVGSGKARRSCVFACPALTDIVGLHSRHFFRRSLGR